MTVLAIATKVIGCGIPARVLGMGTRESLLLGFGMSPRGEVAMIVALIGLTQGILREGIHVAIVLMSLLTTIFTPIVFRSWLYREDLAPEGGAGP